MGSEWVCKGTIGGSLSGWEGDGCVWVPQGVLEAWGEEVRPTSSGSGLEGWWGRRGGESWGEEVRSKSSGSGLEGLMGRQSGEGWGSVWGSTWGVMSDSEVKGGVNGRVEDGTERAVGDKALTV